MGRPPCPECRSPNTVRIVYGEPTPATFEAAERGELVLGGCVIDESSPTPTHACLACERRFVEPPGPSPRIESAKPLDVDDSWTARILEALGHPDAFVTEESLVSDFLDVTARDHLQRRGRYGPWRAVKGDPVAAEENKALLEHASKALGVEVHADERVQELAERVRAAATRRKNKGVTK